MSTQQFNAPNELAEIRNQRVARRRKTYQHSRLIKLRTEIVSLRKSGASFREIALWLRQTKRIKMAHTSVMRYLAKLPEINGDNNA
jgi:IS30 family transposase